MKVNSSEATNLSEIKRSLQRFFLIKRHKGKATCELCLKSLESQKEKDNSSLTSDTLQVVLNSFLAPCNIQTSHLKCSLTLCYSCTMSFTGLAKIFNELEKLRTEFNDLRVKLGVKVIEESLGLSADEWKSEIKKMEVIFPSCVRSMIKLKDVGVGIENKLSEVDDDDNSSADNCDNTDCESQKGYYTKHNKLAEKVNLLIIHSELFVSKFKAIINC